MTWTDLNVPDVPTAPPPVVASPTLTTSMSSSSTFKISDTEIVDIPLKWIIVVAAPIWDPKLLSNVCVTSVLISGYCATSSITIKAFSFDLAMLNSCAFPSPGLMKVTAVPAFVVDIKNESFSAFTTNTVEGNVWIPTPDNLYWSAVDPTPTKVDFGS